MFRLVSADHINMKSSDVHAVNSTKGELAVDGLEELLTPGQLAAMAHVSVGTLGNWRWKGFGPAYVKLGRSVRYRIDDVRIWLRAQLIEPRDETTDRP